MRESAFAVARRLRSVRSRLDEEREDGVWQLTELR
jgi:hypothetical protein